MLQSKQTWLPILHQPTNFNKVIAANTYKYKLIAHCKEHEKNDIKSYINSTSVQILIGPEGDFTNDEINQAIEAGYKPVSLGNTRLRTETAGVVAATFLAI